MAWRLIRNLDHKLFMIAVEEGPGLLFSLGFFFEYRFLESTSLLAFECNINPSKTGFCRKGRQLEFMGPARWILIM